MPFMADLHKKRSLRTALTIGAILVASSAAHACSISSVEPTSTIPAATATETATSTPTPTPTPTAIPAPQGVWSQYWNSNDVEDLVMDGEGFLWGRGSASVIRWDPDAGTYQEFGISQGLPANLAEQMFLGPQGKVWLFFSEHGLWRFDDPGWTPFVEQGVVEGGLNAYAVGPDEVLWVCTDEGLSKYDGETWTAYQMPGGSAGGFCRYLTVDNQGNPWMQGTRGISVLHELDGWVHYTRATSSSGETIDYRYPIGAFTAPDRKLWFVYHGGDVLYLDGDEWYDANIRFMSAFSLSSTGQPWVVREMRLNQNDIATYVYGTYLKVDLSGEENPVWVAGYHWEAPFEDRMPTEQIANGLADAFTLAAGGTLRPIIFPGPNGEVWIKSYDGLLHIRGNSISLIPIEGLRDSSDIRDVEISRRGDVFLALPDGISRLYGEQLIPLHAEVGLTSGNISKLAVGLDGILWILTNKGVQSFDGVSWTMHSLPPTTDLKIAANGDVWVAHTILGVSRWDGNNWERLTIEAEPEYLIESYPRLAIGPDGVVWLASVGWKWILSYDGSTWTAYPYEDDMDFLPQYGFAADGRGEVYLLARNDDLGTCLHTFDGDVWTREEVGEQGAYLATNPDGSVWMWGSESIFEISEGEWSGFDWPANILGGRVLALQFAPDGSLWLGTDNGAWRYDGQEWHQYTTADGLRSNMVYAIAIGPDNTIWFGSGSGLARLGPP